MIRTDLHIHSCLSPCADDEMTPFDLVGLSKLNGLELIALTDHNSTKNCPAAALAAREYGIGFIPGAEVNTAEDIHCICLFPSLERAAAFGELLQTHLPQIENRPDIFGNQIIMAPDGSTKTEEPLLIAACDIPILSLPGITARYDGLCYPAHVDRDSNGLFAVLGTWPQELQVKAAEIRFRIPEGLPEDIKIIRASDAHNLQSLPEGGFPLPLNKPDFESLKQYLG